MLRNIPNKLDWVCYHPSFHVDIADHSSQLSLKALLDQVCFGTYDFVYLRIDFKTGHNVGYAFINFSDVGGMIAMLDKIEGCGWIGYRSNKNAEISYATIQGREALVQKFRNSSVMQETPFCRPRLFMPYEDAMDMNQIRVAGVEQPFPAPDNLSKLQRSMDSARTVGLFPPSGVTNNGQRMAITGFDRGNPRDERQVNPTRMVPTMTEPIKRECEYFNFHKNGPSASGALVPFEFLSQNVVADFMRMHRHNARVRSVDPGVIGRPQVDTMVNEQQHYAASGANAFAPRYAPVYGQASGVAAAGPSSSPRGYNSTGRVLGDSFDVRMSKSFCDY